MVVLTGKGRAALSAYIQALRDLLGGLDVDATSPAAPSPAVPSTRLVGDAKLKQRAEIATRQESP